MKPLVSLALLMAVSAVYLRSQTVDKPLQVGGDVKAPVLIKQVEPKYKRPVFGKPKEGNVLVGMVLGQDGVPTHLTIQRSMDKNFDKAALDAVRQYRFKPATREEKPVAVELNIAVQFRVF